MQYGEYEAALQAILRILKTASEALGVLLHTDVFGNLTFENKRANVVYRP